MPRPTQSAIAASVACALLGVSSSLHAIGLGIGDVRSRLGEPLRLVVPVRLDASETLQPSCVQIARRPDESIPAAAGAQIAIEQTPAGAPAIVVSTGGPVYEPIVRVIVEVGCPAVVSREFVLLLDPPVGGLAAAPEARSAPGSTADPKAATPPASVAEQIPLIAAPARPTAPSRKTSVRKPSVSASDAPAEGRVWAGARSAASARTDTRAPRGDRVRLVDPTSGVSGGMRVTDMLASGAATPRESAGKFREEQARLAALLLDKDVAGMPSAREAELTMQLQSLGSEIQALKRQMAEQGARAQSERAAAAPVWLVYLLAAIAAAAAALAAIMYARSRRVRRIMIGAPWWDDTQMRAGRDPAGPAPTAQRTEARPAPAAAVARDPDVSYPKHAADSTATQPGRISARRLHEHDNDFPDRLQDSTIEVHELGATQALQMLRRGDGQGQPSGPEAEALPTALMPRGSSGPHIDDSTSLSSLDFDLGALDSGARESSNGNVPSSLSTLPVASPSPPEIPAENVSSPGAAGDARTQSIPADMPFAAAAAAPAFLARMPQAMSWSDARQAQDYLRQVAETIEQADAYMAAGQTESAASVLRKLITEKRGAPRAPWLMLLQLYRKAEKREAYDTLLERFVERFGRKPAEWDAARPAHEPGLDSDPDLLQAIWAKWGAAESMGLLSKLLYENDGPDSTFLNLTLQRDLLNFVKICPLDGG